MSENKKYIIDMEYNPYENKVKIDKFDCNHDLCKGSFAESLEKVMIKFKHLIQGKDDIELIFSGRIYEYKLTKSKIEYTYKSSSKKITFKHIPMYDYNIKEIEEKIKELPDDFFENKEKRKLLLEQLNSNIEMYIVGLYSSGKSTFINAILGDSLLYTHSDAATSKICKIIDNNVSKKNITTFKNGKRVSAKEYTENRLIADALKNHNTSADIDTIHLEIDIPNIDSSHFKIELIDTPGVNNEQDTSHQTMAYNAIGNLDSFPPIILIIDPYIYRSTDQVGVFKSLLNVIESAQKYDGKINLERFFFIINKADMIPFNEYEGIYENIKKLIEDKLGEGARIYSTNAEYALLIRKQIKSNEPNKTIRRFIEDIETNEINYLPKYSTRVTSSDSIVVDENDTEETKLQKALIYTGIPMVEEALQEYLTNHAVVQKLEYTFKKLNEVKATQEDKKYNNTIALERALETKSNLNQEGKTKEEQIASLDKQKQKLEDEIKKNRNKKKALEQFTNSMQSALKKYQTEIENLEINDERLNKLQHEWTNYIVNLTKIERSKTYKNEKDVATRNKKINEDMNNKKREIATEADTNMRQTIKTNASDIVENFFKVIDENISYLGENGAILKNEIKVKFDDAVTVAQTIIQCKERKFGMLDIAKAVVTVGISYILRNKFEIDINTIQEDSKMFQENLETIKKDLKTQLDELKKMSKKNIIKFNEIIKQKQEDLENIQRDLDDSFSNIAQTEDNIRKGKDAYKTLNQEQNKVNNEIERLRKEISKNQKCLDSIDSILAHQKAAK